MPPPLKMYDFTRKTPLTGAGLKGTGPLPVPTRRKTAEQLISHPGRHMKSVLSELAITAFALLGVTPITADKLFR